MLALQILTPTLFAFF